MSKRASSGGGECRHRGAFGRDRKERSQRLLTMIHWILEAHVVQMEPNGAMRGLGGSFWTPRTEHTVATWKQSTRARAWSLGARRGGGQSYRRPREVVEG